MNYRYKTKDQAGSERLSLKQMHLAYELSDDLLYEVLLDNTDNEHEQKIDQN